MEETAVSDGDGICVLQVSSLHVGGLYPDTVIMSVEEEGDGPDAEEELGRGIVWNDTIFIMEL